ncbi:MAG: hypothetical protein GW859_05335 [Sphingomonadales bacterium]|nr:hypothetical protein [Sphingomonadales bacterium]
MKLPCPACHEDIALLATKCPHCHHVLTEGEVKERRKNALATGIGCAVLLVVAILGLAFCASGGDGEVKPDVVETNTSVVEDAVDSKAEIDSATREAEATYEAIALPAGAPPAPTAAVCSTALCATQQVSFERQDWPNAWKGDYEAMRNVAFCLGSSCDGAVQIDQVSSCAWRAALVELNPMEAGDLDGQQLQTECGNLTETQIQIAIRKAGELIERIGG